MLDRTIQPEINDIESVKYLLPEQWQLGNGINVWGLNGGSQELVKIDFIFEAGTWYQPANLVAGLSNAFMNQGSLNYSAQEIAEIFDAKGAYLTLNADQQFGSVSILTLNKYFAEIMKVTADVIKNPVFPQKEISTQIAKKKQQFIVENNKVKVLAQKRFSQVLFGESHAYANTNKASDYSNLKREHLVDFHRKHYIANNCRIIVAGLYNGEVKDALEHYFGDQSSMEGIGPSQRDNLIQSASVREHFVKKAGSLQSAMRVGRLVPNRTHPDYNGLSILATILGGYFGSRLMMNIREEKGYTYGIGAGIFSMKNAAFFSVSTEVGTEFCRPTLDEIYAELKRMCDEPVPAHELDTVKRYLFGETYRSFDGVFAMSNSLRALVEADLDYSHYDGFIDKLKTITPAELQELACKYLNPADMFQVVAGAEL